MDILSLIKKIDQDRKILPTYPDLATLFPVKSMYQANFLTQLDSVLTSQKPTSNAEKLKAAIGTSQKSTTEVIKSQVSQIKKIKDLNQQDDPEKLLAKLRSIESQVNAAKIGFLEKKKIKKLLVAKEKKYLSYAEFVNNAEQASKQVTSFSLNSVKLEDVSNFKDKLKDIVYYELLIGNLGNYNSIMPELLNKKNLLEGEKR